MFKNDSHNDWLAEEIKNLTKTLQQRNKNSKVNYNLTDYNKTTLRVFDDPKVEYGYLLNTYDTFKGALDEKKSLGYDITDVEQSQLEGIREQINVIARKNGLKLLT